ncbi:MAG: DsrE family protein [Verrucomicrobiota bacterium]|nr:DsrE family protein [Verrucomicrobiota bacterium]
MNKLIKTIALAALLALPVTATNAQTESPAGKTHRIVFEVTMEGLEQWTAALNNVENLRTALAAAAEIEVVAHSKGLGMLIAKDNALVDRMKKLADAGVVFAECENTMKKKNVTKEQLLPFATTTDSGIAEVIRKQEAGWSYIKSGI